jgi:hypothetical protein
MHALAFHSSLGRIRARLGLERKDARWKLYLSLA